MNGLAESAEVPEVTFARRHFKWPIFSVLVIFIAREVLGAKTVLLSQLPPIPWWTACLSGLALAGYVVPNGLLISKRMNMGIKGVIGCASLIPLSIVTSAYLGRWFFELAAFAMGPGVAEPAEIRITGVLPKSRSLGYRALAMFSPDGREIQLFVNQNVYLQLSAIRPPLWSRNFADQQFCFNVPVEHGRWGTWRAHVPAIWDRGMDHFVRCKSPSDENRGAK